MREAGGRGCAKEFDTAAAAANEVAAAEAPVARMLIFSGDIAECWQSPPRP